MLVGCTQRLRNYKRRWWWWLMRRVGSKLSRTVYQGDTEMVSNWLHLEDVMNLTTQQVTEYTTGGYNQICIIYGVHSLCIMSFSSFHPMQLRAAGKEETDWHFQFGSTMDHWGTMWTLGDMIGFYTDLAQNSIGLRNIGSFLCHHGSIAICADLLYICALHSDFADACYAQPIWHSANQSDGVFSQLKPISWISLCRGSATTCQSEASVPHW